MLSLHRYYADTIRDMMIALYRTAKTGNQEYYYIHDYQGHLFSPHTFTVIWGKDLGVGKERSFTFTNRADMDKKLRELFRSRINIGYKLLYSYPQENSYNEIYTNIARKKAL